ncbi:peroxiredoxin-like family protein [Flindersiella endophytica]
MTAAIEPRELRSIHGAQVPVPDPGRLVHLQFRRYAGCPICNLHLRSFTARHEEIQAAGIVEVVVFHSSTEVMLQYQAELPFAAIADPGRELYTEFGVEASPGAVLHPRAWPAALRGALSQRSLRGMIGKGEAHLGLPADFLIATNGTVLARKYGRHANDQWSVDELLGLTRPDHGDSAG